MLDKYLIHTCLLDKWITQWTHRCILIELLAPARGSRVLYILIPLTTSLIYLKKGPLVLPTTSHPCGHRYKAWIWWSLEESNHLIIFMGVPDSSVGKESACNAGDPSSIPGSGRSPGEGIDYPLQYSWASLVAQLVRICLQCGRPGFKPWVGKIPWRKERLPPPVILVWRIPWTA